MRITYYGNSCFRIKSKKGLVVTDPFSPKSGLKMPKLKADVVTITDRGKENDSVDKISGTKKHPQPFVVKGPGEYGVGQIYIQGFPSFKSLKADKKDQEEERNKTTIYLIDIKGVRFCHAGNLSHKLSKKTVESLNQVEVLFIPVGGGSVLDSQQANELIGQLEPNYVIPMQYQLPDLKLKYEPLSEFLKEIGLEEVKPETSLWVKSSRLPEEREVVVLKNRS